MRKLGLVSFVIIVVCVMAGAAFAEPVVLVRMKGTVEVMLGNSEAWVKALPDVELREGDRLRTAEDGKAELFFPEETLLLIREHSEIRITAEGEGGGGSIQAIIGGILVNIRGSLSPGSKFEVDGSSALAVVRGTVLRVEVLEDGTSLWHGFESPVEVYNEQGRWVMEPGTNCRVDPFSFPIPGGCRARTLAECIREFAIDETDLAWADEVEATLAGL